MTDTQNAQELVAKMRKIIGDPQEWWEPSRATRLLDVATELSERLKPSDTQNDTSELVDKIYGMAIGGVSKDYADKLIDDYCAQREQAAELRGRIDELDKTIEIWIHNRSDEEYANYLERRKATLQATKPEKGGLER